MDNNSVHIGLISCGVMDWIDLAQDRNQWRVLLNEVMTLRISWNAGNPLSSCTTGGFMKLVNYY
jgi:hypothetical protein